MKVEQQELDRLAGNAKSLLDSLNSRSAAERRPIFVEFAGTPKSGKSTCIDTINHFFRRMGYKVLAPTEGASKRTPYLDFVHLNDVGQRFDKASVKRGEDFSTVGNRT